jgi:hypothetical protein
MLSLEPTNSKTNAGEWLHVSLVGASSGSRCMTVHDHAADNVIVYIHIREEGQWAVANVLQSVSPPTAQPSSAQPPF